MPERNVSVPGYRGYRFQTVPRFTGTKGNAKNRTTYGLGLWSVNDGPKRSIRRRGRI